MATETTIPVARAILRRLTSETKATVPAVPSVSTQTTTPLPESFQDLVPGYPTLAGRMGVMPEIGMFRRFGALNARNLLYLQNDLVMLEQELKLVEAEDAKSDKGKKERYSRNAYWLSNSDERIKGQLRDGDTRQRDLVLQMRSLLNEYSMSPSSQNCEANISDASKTMHSFNRQQYFVR